MQGEYRTNANQSQFAAKSRNLRGTKLAPLGESGGAVDLEVLSAVETALQIEMVLDYGENGNEFLQCLPPPEAEHRPLPPSKGRV